MENWREMTFFLSGPDNAGSKYKGDCFGHGKDLAGRCRCNKQYYGHRCQFKDECVEDQDCGRHGRCVDLDATSAPRRQCFCQMGWFGPDCTKRQSKPASFYQF